MDRLDKQKEEADQEWMSNARKRLLGPAAESPQADGSRALRGQSTAAESTAVESTAPPAAPSEAAGSGSDDRKTGEGEVKKYEVETVDERRQAEDGSGFEFLVKWKGYPSEENTWEPECNLSSAKDAIKALEERQRGASSRGAEVKEEDDDEPACGYCYGCKANRGWCTRAGPPEAAAGGEQVGDAAEAPAASTSELRSAEVERWLQMEQRATEAAEEAAAAPSQETFEKWTCTRCNCTSTSVMPHTAANWAAFGCPRCRRLSIKDDFRDSDYDTIADTIKAVKKAGATAALRAKQNWQASAGSASERHAATVALTREPGKLQLANFVQQQPARSELGAGRRSVAEPAALGGAVGPPAAEEEEDEEDDGRVTIEIPAKIKPRDVILIDLPGGTQVSLVVPYGARSESSHRLSHHSHSLPLHRTRSALHSFLLLMH